MLIRRPGLAGGSIVVMQSDEGLWNDCGRCVHPAAEGMQRRTGKDCCSMGSTLLVVLWATLIIRIGPLLHT